MLFFELNKFFAIFLKNLFNSRVFKIVGGGDTPLPVIAGCISDWNDDVHVVNLLAVRTPPLQYADVGAADWVIRNIRFRAL